MWSRADELWLISFNTSRCSQRSENGFRLHWAARLFRQDSDLDQQAFQIVQGFQTSKEQRVFGGYELTIEKASSSLRKQELRCREALEFLEHVIVDESQDVVGRRAEQWSGF